jgi:lysophospholipase L1-like esterase
MIATRLVLAARLGFSALVLSLGVLRTLGMAAESGPVEFRQDDRVVLLGGTFIERLQVYGHLETRLTAALGGRNVTFRNLGWSGDTVWGEARAVFGTPADGFKRLVKDTLDAKPTLLLIQYGANEAQAGPTGIPEFIAQYGRLLDALAPTKARIALLSPVRREQVSPKLPDPAPYNSQLDDYCQAIAEFARSRGVAYVDLRDLFANPPQLTSAKEATRTFHFTDNGLHPNEPGSLLVADRIAGKLGVPTVRWTVAANANAASAPAGLNVELISRDSSSLKFKATAAHLPAPPVYRNRQPGGQGGRVRQASGADAPSPTERFPTSKKIAHALASTSPKPPRAFNDQVRFHRAVGTADRSTWRKSLRRPVRRTLPTICRVRQASGADAPSQPSDSPTSRIAPHSRQRHPSRHGLSTIRCVFTGRWKRVSSWCDRSTRPVRRTLRRSRVRSIVPITHGTPS